MIYDNINKAALYEKWLKDNTNISETEETKNAFYAGYYAAFNRIMDLMRRVDMLTKADSSNAKQ